MVAFSIETAKHKENGDLEEFQAITHSSIRKDFFILQLMCELTALQMYGAEFDNLEKREKVAIVSVSIDTLSNPVNIKNYFQFVENEVDDV